MTYVTVDLDWPSRLEIIKSWHRVADMSDAGVEGRVSSSGTGVHIRTAETPVYPTPIAERKRRHAGDDPTRIDGDVSNTLQSNQVLYDCKGESEAREWVGDMEELLDRYVVAVPITPTEHKARHGE
jgi:hypothetical protein